MARWSVNVNTKGLLDYVKAGKEAMTRVKKAVRRVMNVGRTEARRQIGSQFRVRTGFLKRQARKMQTRVIVKPSEIKGQVSPIPRLMNIFEGGATLAYGRGYLAPRPVVTPAASSMKLTAPKEFEQVLQEVGT